MNPLYIQTPLLQSPKLSELFGGQVTLKMEAMQPSGSFKNRGIGNICAYYAKNENAKCFVSSSGGNAGLAAAYAGRLLNVLVKIVVPETSSKLMVKKIEEEAAQVIIHGKDWNEADLLARKLALEPGAFYISPFDHPLIWKGHASLIHEVKTFGEKPDAVVVAVGGGGLFCGVVEGLKDVGWADVPIFTAETEGAASLAKSIEANKLITLDAIKTVATSLGAKRVAEQAFEHTKTHKVFPKIVSDSQAIKAVAKFAEDHRVLVEPACGAALSLIYDRMIDHQSYKNVLVVVCGGGAVTPQLIQQWIDQT